MKVFLPVLLATLLGVEQGEVPSGPRTSGSCALLLDSPSAFPPNGCPGILGGFISV